MKNIIAIIFIIATITVLSGQLTSTYYKVRKLSAKYSPCYQCNKPKTYYIFELPDTLKKRIEAKENGCEPIRAVRFCGYKGQIIINKNH